MCSLENNQDKTNFRGTFANFYIRRALKEDIVELVDVHLVSFQGFFLSFLGSRFLILLYKEILDEPGNVSLVAVSNTGKIVGFVVGVIDQGGLYKKMARNKWFSFASAAFGKALLHPSIIPRLFRALLLSKKTEISASPAVLMSIAVLPYHKGEGIGQSLVNEFLEDMANQGVEKVCLTTDRDENDTVNRFYRKKGFHLTRQFKTAEGRWMNEYAIETKRI